MRAIDTYQAINKLLTLSTDDLQLLVVSNESWAGTGRYDDKAVGACMISQVRKVERYAGTGLYKI